MTADFVTLADGCTVPFGAARLLWDLETRGCRFRIEGDRLVASPRSMLTNKDRLAISKWRWHLLELVAHCEQEAVH